MSDFDGYQVGSGLIGSVLGAAAMLLGFKRRVDRLEERVDGVVTVKECETCRVLCQRNQESVFKYFRENNREIKENLNQINKKLDRLAGLEE